MFSSEIAANWSGQPYNYASAIPSLKGTESEAWTIKTATSVGVAIPFSGNGPVHESFASVEMFDEDVAFPDEGIRKCLLLLADGKKETHSFATLCSEFVAPGPNGSDRKMLSSDPVTWWLEWKELLGNKNISERVYDVIAELSVLAYIAENGEFAEWNGPSGATYDIECDSRFVEVKSTTMRKRKAITLSNQFQLIPPDGRKLNLILCQLEASSTGRSINSLVDQLADLGYSKMDLDAKLTKLGFRKGKSVRNRCYILHSMTEYVVDDSFPAIRDSSFAGGKMPQCVESLSYTVSLDGIDGKALLPSDGGYGK